MALATSILNQIRDEIGTVADYSDTDLETIYVDEDRGNYSTLATALIVWRRRLGDLMDRSFDITTEGSLLARSQKVRYMERRIKELELVADETLRGENMSTTGLNSYEAASAEFS